jgi:VIT1/CCC1 family predicted Fe2+/Mn2+ transporter
VARQISQNPDRALEVHARNELGVGPGELPSPMLAAVSSFLSFAVGAFVPVLPYLLGAQTILLPLVLTAIALFGAGALTSKVTTRTWWYSGTRQLLLGALAGGVTYLFGSLVGAGLG